MDTSLASRLIQGRLQMSFRQQAASVLIALAAVLAVGYGAFLFTSGLIDKLNSISGDLSKALVAAGLAGVISVLTLVLGKVWEQRIKIRQDIREKKIPVYEGQIATFFSTMFAAKLGQPEANRQEIEKAFVSFSQKLIIWGGPDVIRAWCDFRKHDWESSTPRQAFDKLDAFMKAIRNELGNDSSKLNNGELLKLFINDYDALAPVPHEARTPQPSPMVITNSSTSPT